MELSTDLLIKMGLAASCAGLVAMIAPQPSEATGESGGTQFTLSAADASPTPDPAPTAFNCPACGRG